MNPVLCAELAAWMRLNAVAAWGPDRLREQAAKEGVVRLARSFEEWDAGREWQRARDLGLSVVAWDEPEFPELLRSIADAPLVLYVRGRLEAGRDALAFVGSRQPTPYGRRMTRALVREAAPRFAIVSGLARGIDTEAHRAALEAGGATWAVLGSGLSRLYPPENEALAREIAASGGCVLSEFPLDVEPRAGNFPRRNRIVSGLSWGTVVIEGREQSGSLITARLAVQQGREVFAVPGPADSPLSAAPLRLISQGAKMARSLADILPELPPGCQDRQPAAPAPSGKGERLPSRDGAPLRAVVLAQTHKKILELLGSETRTVAELGAEAGLDLSGLTQILFEMELQDLVEAVPGQRYAKKNA